MSQAEIAAVEDFSSQVDALLAEYDLADEARRASIGLTLKLLAMRFREAGEWRAERERR